jgi:predicted MFS family arabinose efflux permease
MGWALAIFGVIVALAGFGIGFTEVPTGAPQQVVQRLDVLCGIAGVIITAMGAGIDVLSVIARAVTRPEG